MTELKLRIGSRKSELALKQTYIIEDLLKKAYPGLETEIVTSDTLGDKNLISPLQAFGGKGVFVSELEDALLSGEIDLAVHSAKDMPMEIMEGLTISGTLPRACPQDVLIYKSGRIFDRFFFFRLSTLYCRDFQSKKTVLLRRMLERSMACKCKHTRTCFPDSSRKCTHPS